MKVTYKKDDKNNRLIIETKDLHPSDLFFNNDLLLKLTNEIKENIKIAYKVGKSIRMDVYSSHGNQDPTQYQVIVKNEELKTKDDCEFKCIAI